MDEESCLSEGLNDKKWIFYKDREEWKDIEPVPQNDGPFPVVAIVYSKKFTDVYDYFRAILLKQEKSERVLELTKDAVELNPANYTVWQYRREVLKHLNKDLREELKFLRYVIEVHKKNYQVWHHRRLIVEWLQDPSQELRFCEIILASDAKNYHAWQYRQWVIKTFNLFDSELEFVEQLLEGDVRNNSAWNQRYFVISNTTGFTSPILEFEVKFTLNKIKLVTCNESAWNYLRGIMLHCSFDSPTYQKVRKFCQDLYNDENRSPCLLSYIVDLCEEMIELNANDEFYTLTLALELCDALAKKHDKIRCHYWSYVGRTLSQKVTSNCSEENPQAD